MIKILLFCVVILSGCAGAPTKETVVNPAGRIWQTDALGNIQYHKPSAVTVGNKVYQTDAIGNIKYNKPSLIVTTK